MKTKTMRWMTAAFCGLVMLTGCVDKNDNPVVTPDEPTTEVDPVTQEEYENQELMDRSVKPGDSFYNFALGTWLKNHDEDDNGLQANLYKTVEQGTNMLFRLSNQVDALTKLCDKTNKGLETQGILSIDEDLQSAYIDIIAQDKDDASDVTTKDKAIKILASLIKKGFTPIVKCDITNVNGTFKKVLTAGNIPSDVKQALQSGNEDFALFVVKDIVSSMLNKEGNEDITDEEVETVAEYILTIDKLVYNNTNEFYADDDDLRLRFNAKPGRTLMPSQLHARTRGAAQETLWSQLDINDDNSVIDEKVKPILEYIDSDETIADNLIVYMMYILTSENLDLVKSAPNASGSDDEDGKLSSEGDEEQEDLETTVYNKLSKVAPEIINSIDYDYLKAADTHDAEGCRAIMEEMRKLMATRIDNLDWMSDATKAAAKKKLEKMEFYIGVPDTQPGTDIEITADDKTTVVGIVQQLRQQRYEKLMALANKPTSGNGWNFIVHKAILHERNSMYGGPLNQLFILPFYISEGMFPKDNDAMRYATTIVFGHEMCHGFDVKGSEYDETGTYKDWWQASDKAAFVQKAEQMVARYNELIQYGTTHADGEKTLNENIADLGGVTLAFGVYKQKLQADGLSEEEINHKLREFFLHYALLWQSDQSITELAQLLTIDVHSTDQNRVDGITRLMDEWYELFNVTDGDLYLAPADRVKIW